MLPLQSSALSLGCMHSFLLDYLVESGVLITLELFLGTTKGILDSASPPCTAVVAVYEHCGARNMERLR